VCAQNHGGGGKRKETGIKVVGGDGARRPGESKGRFYTSLRGGGGGGGGGGEKALVQESKGKKEGEGKSMLTNEKIG